MERLTDKDEYGYYAPRDVTLNCLKHRGKLVDRLAAYEDTELEPEEIKAKLDGLDEFQKLEAADAIEELQKRVELEYQSGFADGQRAANRKKNKWISVKERLPEKSGLYLTYHAKRGSMTMHYSVNNEAWNAFDHEDRPKYALKVTHWMPLPEPPEVKK